MSRVKLQTLLDRSNRNMARGTHPVVRESALEIVRRAYAEGINAQISEGHRSYARQNALYAQGRSKPGNIVTNARGGQSWHNFGIAVDYFLTSNDGSRAIWTVNADWRRVAQIGKALGFEWGGDWTSFVDYPHLQMTGGYSLAQLRAGKKPNLVSKVDNKGPKPQPSNSQPKPSQSKWKEKKGNWTGGVLKQWDRGNQVKQLQEMLADNYYYPEKGAKNDGIDSYFGAKTKNAVERYQSMHGLTIDGIAGKATYKSLNGSSPQVSKPERPSYVGKRVESITNGELRFYDKRSWKDKDVAGTVKKGYGFPTIVKKHTVGSGEQYEVKNSNGATFYITANSKYVSVK